jgi:hypothetical protein
VRIAVAVAAAATLTAVAVAVELRMGMGGKQEGEKGSIEGMIVPLMGLLLGGGDASMKGGRGGGCSLLRRGVKVRRAHRVQRPQHRKGECL